MNKNIIKAINVLKRRGYRVIDYEVSENIAHLFPKSFLKFDIFDENDKPIVRNAIPVVFSDENPTIAFAEWWGDRVLYVNTETFEVVLK